MGKARIAAVLGVPLAAIAAGALYAGHTIEETNHIPEEVLMPVSQLPQAEASNVHGRICLEEPTPCTTESALAVLAIRPQQDIPITDVPKYTQQAFVDKEDVRFWDRPQGCDARAVMAAATADTKTILLHKIGVENGPITIRGGSTIWRQAAGVIYHVSDEDLRNSQPFVQAVYKIDPTKTKDITRQVYECAIALKMDDTMSKDEVLDLYLNRVYFGRGVYGLQEAAQAYFGVDAKNLSPIQSMKLAALLTEPSAMDVDATDLKSLSGQQKLNHEGKKWQQQFDVVVDQMEKAGDLSQADAAAARSMTFDQFTQDLLPYTPRSNGNNLERAKQLGLLPVISTIVGEAGEVMGKTKDEVMATSPDIYVSINPQDQQALLEAVNNDPKVKSSSVDRAGISLDTQSRVVAVVNQAPSADQVNIAMDGKRTAGSSLKPYLFGLEYTNGLGPDSAVTIPAAVSVPLPGAKPWVVASDQGCGELGVSASSCKTTGSGKPITTAMALAVSSNTFAAEGVKQFGIKSVAEKMAAFGMPATPDQETPSLILGAGHEGFAPLDLAYGMRGMTEGGTAIFYGDQPYSLVDKVTDQLGNIIYSRPEKRIAPVFSSAVSQALATAMKSVVNKPYGTAYQAINSPAGVESVAGKTGTAAVQSGNKLMNADLWFTGTIADVNPLFTRTVSIWFGHAAGETPLPSSLRSWNPAYEVGRYATLRPHTNQAADVAALSATQPVG